MLQLPLQYTSANAPALLPAPLLALLTSFGTADKQLAFRMALSSLKPVPIAILYSSLQNPVSLMLVVMLYFWRLASAKSQGVIPCRITVWIAVSACLTLVPLASEETQYNPQKR